MLLRLQKAELTTVQSRLEQAISARDSLEDQLSKSAEREASLAGQLAASTNSESMLRLAAEELNLRVDELTVELRDTMSRHTSELSKIESDLAHTSSEARAADEKSRHTIDALESDLAQVRTSEAELKQQLEQTLKELDQVKEMRYTDEVARKKLHATIQDLKGSIRVFCRVRPAGVTTASDAGHDEKPLFDRAASSIDHGLGSTLSNFTEDLHVSAPSGATKVDGSHAKPLEYKFNFDKVFLPGSSQGELFKELEELVVSSMDASANVAVFAYGATGSVRKQRDTMQIRDGTLTRSEILIACLSFYHTLSFLLSG